MSGRLQNTLISSVMVRMKVSIHTASPIATRLAVCRVRVRVKVS